MSDRNKHPEQDSAEGSPEVIDHELQRSEKQEPGADREAREQARQELKRQVEQETDLLQKGSA
jgi:hypothetical protein